MAYKPYGQQSFQFKHFALECWSQQTKYGFRHVCDVVNLDTLDTFRVSCPYYNRTWESFKYQTALSRAVDKLPEAFQEEARQWIHMLAEAERARCLGDWERFMAEFKKLPESMKDTIAALGPIETEEQAKQTTAIMAMYNIITGR